VFEKKTFSQLFEAMRDRTRLVVSDFDFQEGSVVQTLVESFAYEMAVLYEQMQQVDLSAYVDTATGEQLDQVVAILGIQRGEPDFAIGTVTFVRDVGIDEDIVIPLNTLVTTEDKSDSPKKAYETIELKSIPKDKKSVQVRVQALQRGETEVTEAETIIVMPQPVSGVKSVHNEEPIRFTGKRQETDEQLKDRAKTTLLAASGGNSTSIQNALLSLPGVKEVQVRENFHFAKGKVTLTSLGKVVIPKKTKLELNDGSRSFETTEEVTIEANSSVEVTIQALVTGEAGEILKENTSWKSFKIDEVTVTVSKNEPILLRDFGAVEVFVDSVDFEKQKGIFQEKIDQVRAAGIYILLKPAIPVKVDGVFQIQLTPGLKLSQLEREELEQKVKIAIEIHLKEQKMGQPLLISQLTNQILGINGVSDLENFTLTTWREKQQPVAYESSVKRLEVDILEKFTPQYIRVASETKSLLVDVQVQSEQLNEIKANQILEVLKEYFSTSRRSLQKSEIINQLQSQNIQNVKLIPHFWQPALTFDGEIVKVSFVEQAQLGQVFIYDKILQITGALQLTLPIATTQEKRQEIQKNVRSGIETYFEQLKPEEAIQIEQLVKIAKETEKVLDVSWRLEDFQIVNIPDSQNRINQSQKTIRIDKFEKAQLAQDFVIDSEIQIVSIVITSVKLRLNTTGLIPENLNKEQLKTLMIDTVQSIFDDSLSQQLPQLETGKTLDYQQFKNNFQVLIRDTASNLSQEKIKKNLQSEDLSEEQQKQLLDTAKNLLSSSQYTVDNLELTARNKIYQENIPIRIVERGEIKSLNLTSQSLIITIEIPSS
jgi:uncharacterized phage protein gp47/JayE